MSRPEDDRDTALDADDEALVARVRALPPEGVEPDWRELENAIRARVHTLRTPVPWWRNWRYLLPIGALATTAAVALLVVGGHPDTPREPTSATATRAIPHDAGDVTQPVPTATAAASALWLDGEAVDLDELPAETLDVVPAPDELTGAITGEISAEHDDEDGILPVSDYGWIDTLDDDAVGRAELWLARKRS